MVLHQGILPQIIQKLYVTMKSAAKLFWTEYLQTDGALRKILQVPQSFFHLQPVIMLTVQFLLLTADGWDVNFIPQSAIIKSGICIEIPCNQYNILDDHNKKTNNHKNITTMQIRFESSPREVKTMDTASLRREFLVENLMTEDNISLTYSHYDRLIIGGTKPVKQSTELETHERTKSRLFSSEKRIRNY